MASDPRPPGPGLAPEAAPSLAPEARRRRRARSVALGLALGALALLFYLVTIAKMGPQILHRAM
jgi:ferric-dicitrate binding protein FerR (iron transport regulator)